MYAMLLFPNRYVNISDLMNTFLQPQPATMSLSPEFISEHYAITAQSKLSSGSISRNGNHREPSDELLNWLPLAKG